MAAWFVGVSGVIIERVPACPAVLAFMAGVLAPGPAHFDNELIHFITKGTGDPMMGFVLQHVIFVPTV